MLLEVVLVVLVVLWLAKLPNDLSSIPAASKLFQENPSFKNIISVCALQKRLENNPSYDISANLKSTVLGQKNYRSSA